MSSSCSTGSIDKSLVYTDRSGAETRFRMLQTLSDYASTRLVARGEDDAARRAHAPGSRALADSVEFGARTTGATVAAVHDEDVAVRDAVAWALVAEPRLALEICSMLAPFWFGTMRVSAGWELLARALDAAGGDDPALRSSALGVGGRLQHDGARHDGRRPPRRGSRRRSRAALGDPERLGRICFARALAAGYRADDVAGRWVAEAPVELRPPPGSTSGLGHVSLAEGAADCSRATSTTPPRAFAMRSTIFRAEQDHLGLILAVSRLGEAAWRSGDLDLFAAMHAELLDLGRAGRSSGVVAGATARLALATSLQGDVDQAQSLADQALAASGETFMPVVNGYTFKTAGLVNLELGHVSEGRAHLHEAIDAFELGTGSLGTGQAALCWIDLSRSYRATDELAERAARDHRARAGARLRRSLGARRSRRAVRTGAHVGSQRRAPLRSSWARRGVTGSCFARRRPGWWPR